MGFLKCKSCGGYYKLQPRESRDDFGACKCGGSLKYVKGLKAARIDELGPFSKTKACPKCRKENVKTSKICVFCGQKLNKGKLTLSDELLRLASILIGIIVVLIHLILFSIGLDIIIIGGFVSSILISKNENECILDGILLGLISGLVFSVYNGILGVDILFDNINSVYVILIGSAVMGLLGGLSGTIARSTITNKDPLYSLNLKAIIVGFIVCAAPLLYFQSSICLLIVILGGITVAYLAKGEYKSGIRNGYLTGILGALIVILLSIFNNPNDLTMVIDKMLHIVVLLLIGGLLGAFGGLIGTHIKKNQ